MPRVAGEAVMPAASRRRQSSRRARSRLMDRPATPAAMTASTFSPGRVPCPAMAATHAPTMSLVSVIIAAASASASCNNAAITGDEAAALATLACVRETGSVLDPIFSFD
jgi:hypothetical protein